MPRAFYIEASYFVTSKNDSFIGIFLSRGMQSMTGDKTTDLHFLNEIVKQLGIKFPYSKARSDS
jgi:hypothetical protein